ncbi:MAG: hypothetical protein FGM32_10700 [Candidatus Kapabacteria bacterium]|nr:hypothetical protein [Candidatus Kapabacteria bacterium]
MTAALIVMLNGHLSGQDSEPIVPETLRSSIWKEHARHNWLAEFIDDFDSTVVRISYGEVRVERPLDTQFVFLEMTRGEFFSQGRGHEERGSSVPGADRTLGERGRTQAFTYQAGSTVVFVRMIETTSNTSFIPQSAYSERKIETWADIRNQTKPGEMVDTVEFALELVDAATHQRLMLIDSVGIRAIGDQAVLNRYGTNPDQWVRRIKLPDQFAGRRVYIRPLPYRYGPSPFGLLHRKFSYEHNTSILYYDLHLVPIGTAPRFVYLSEQCEGGKCAADSLQLAIAMELIRHMATSLETDSCRQTWPKCFSVPPMYAQLYDNYSKTFPASKNALRCYQRAQADTAWILSTLLPEPLEKQAQEIAAQMKSQARFSMRSVSGSIRVTLQGTRSQRNRFVAYDIAGAEIFRGTFPAAPFEDVELPMPESVKGNVLVRCILADGSELATSAIRTE